MRKIAPATFAAPRSASYPLAEASSLGRPCTSAPSGQRLSLDALKAEAEAGGYKVQKAKIKAACSEIFALDKSARTERRRPSSRSP